MISGLQAGLMSEIESHQVIQFRTYPLQKEVGEYEIEFDLLLRDIRAKHGWSVACSGSGRK